MIKKTSKHINNLMSKFDAVRKQFEFDIAELDVNICDNYDPLQESSFEAVPGLIHKYSNRALCLLTSECAAYCRFCTRRRLVSDIELGQITEDHIDKWVDYLNKHNEITEVIISGGDPLIVSDELFCYALYNLSNAKLIKIIRIGTRIPVSDPSLITCCKLRSIEKVRQPVYVGIHFEHPSELTEATIESLRELRKTGVILYSQTVFLKDINDNYDTLYELFYRLPEYGVRPYYIYHCDPVPGAAHFIVDIKKEQQIMTRLRKTLSGIAFPTYVIDAPEGSGKIPVPLGFWNSDISRYTDFVDIEHNTENKEDR